MAGLDGAVTLVKGIHYRTEEPIIIRMQDGFIIDIERDRMESKDESLPWIAPGLVDLQINGYHGADFNTIPIEMGSVEKVTRALWQEGVTSYYPTVITNGDESIEKALLSITEACSHDPVYGSVRRTNFQGCESRSDFVNASGKWCSSHAAPSS
ncbi:hypothetical protein GC098_28005 [Paenibacillus sp. LMG 31458]|uniref:N-acetylglucosamine-6-phosphate deacetylase n=1 Tax=Paenibacillus phytorum TaxID=2654977 RepID=A0ABX1Y2V6_9BACL|nr:hypothetical protein [Paenibacillus phytorum]NOU75187.1 hypothetical protein [Paenibacillus phytorum]